MYINSGNDEVVHIVSPRVQLLYKQAHVIDFGLFHLNIYALLCCLHVYKQAHNIDFGLSHLNIYAL
jgi:hypothetical protein